MTTKLKATIYLVTVLLVLPQVKLPPVFLNKEENSSSEIFKRNHAKIRRKFSSLVTSARKKLEAKNIDINDFSEFVMLFFEGDVGQTVAGTSQSISDIFRDITKHKLWDYMNYYSIEAILEEFGGEDGEINQLLRDYKMELAGFKAATKIADYLNFTKPGGKVSDTDSSLTPNMARYDSTFCQKLSMKLDARVEEKGLLYLDDLWKSVAAHFLLPPLPVLLESICEGCVEVTWLVPPSHAMQIQWNIDGALEFLQRSGIFKVSINDDAVYDNTSSLKNMVKNGYTVSRSIYLRVWLCYCIVQQLLQACVKGDLDLVTALLLNGINPNEGDSEVSEK